MSIYVESTSGTNTNDFLNIFTPLDRFVFNTSSRPQALTVSFAPATYFPNGAVQTAASTTFYNPMNLANPVILGSDVAATASQRGALNFSAVGGAADGNLLLGTSAADTLNTALQDNINASSVFYGLGGNDTITGGSAADFIYGGTGSDSLLGLGGNDLISGDGDGSTAFNNGIVTGNFANDTIGSADFIDGGAGNDTIYGNGGDDTIYGGSGGDQILGGDGNDRLFGESTAIGAADGNDTIDGGAGNDTINGNSGDDVIVGGLGNDLIGGGNGNDVVSGDLANDSIGSTGSADTLAGGNGADTIYGGGGDDVINGGTAGAIDTDDGNDTIFGGGGNDLIQGNGGNDFVDGGTGNDTIGGGAGADRLFGGAGNDSLTGGNGNDQITGGAGTDNLTGSAGNDAFYFGQTGNPLAPSDSGFAQSTAGAVTGFDVITDFNPAQDSIVIQNFNPNFTAGGGVSSDVLRSVGATFTTVSAALTFANSLFDTNGNDDVIALQVGNDAYIFYNSAGGGTGTDIDSIIQLTGANAASIVDANFVDPNAS